MTMLRSPQKGLIASPLSARSLRAGQVWARIDKALRAGDVAGAGSRNDPSLKDLVCPSLPSSPCLAPSLPHTLCPLRPR